MDYVAYHHHLLIAWIFIIPVALIFVKMILAPLFDRWARSFEKPYKNFLEDLTRKYDTFWFSHFYEYDSYESKNEKGEVVEITKEQRNKKYPELESDWKQLEKYKEQANRKFAQRIIKISEWLDDLNCNHSENWIGYCVLSWIVGGIAAICLMLISSDFRGQRALWYHGRYPIIAVYENFEQFPDWEYNAKRRIEKAENLNSTYFESDGSIIKSKVSYIIPDEEGKYPILDKDGNPTGKYLAPINTNKMYASFLKICQSEEELLK